MKSSKLLVDGPYVIGWLPAPAGTLDSPVSIEIFLDGEQCGTAIADRAAGSAVPDRTAKLSAFEFRIPNMPPERNSPVISARLAEGKPFASTAWNAGPRRMARWLGDAEAAVTQAGSADNIVAFANSFRRFARWRPVTALNNKRAAAAIVRNLTTSLCATGQYGNAAQLLASFPLFACLRSSDAALFETFRIIADLADWPQKRRLAALLAFGALRSSTAGALARRMRLSGSQTAGGADAAWLMRLMENDSASPALRAFAAETLVLHTHHRLTGPQ